MSTSTVTAPPTTSPVKRTGGSVRTLAGITINEPPRPETKPQSVPPRKTRIRIIDAHVHDRDEEQKAKSTIRQVAEFAEAENVVARVAMPNTSRPITTLQRVQERWALAEAHGSTKGYYMFIGATKNPDQLREAFRVAKTHPRVVGMKLYAGRTTGDLEILEEEGQETVFRVAVEEGYNSPSNVIAVHAEDEKFAKPELWVPEEPASWNLAKPEIMEIESVLKIIKIALKTGYKGHLHICHVSLPETVEIVNDARRHMNISCCVTPHHLTYSTDDMKGPDDVWLKVNPPIRNRKSMLGLNELLRAGMINGVESDHAPHELKDKQYAEGKPKESYASGIQSLIGLQMFFERLRKGGLTEEQITEFSYLGIKKIFRKIAE
jgi:dihydroorotase